MNIRKHKNLKKKYKEILELHQHTITHLNVLKDFCGRIDESDIIVLVNHIESQIKQIKQRYKIPKNE